VCRRKSLQTERRVALTPDAAGRLTKGGFEVLIERGAGVAAFFPDDAYGAAGATVSDRSSVFSQADIVVQVQSPQAAELGNYREGSALVAFFPAGPRLRATTRAAQAHRVQPRAVARITRAQPMDVLSSQATVAGYKAVLLAASTAPRLFPMLVTAAAHCRRRGCSCSVPASRDGRRSRRRAASVRSSRLLMCVLR